jgi:hypothetical protein
METQTETQAPVMERPKKRPTRRIAAALHLPRTTYRRMRQRAAREGLSFGTWLKRAALKELRRKAEI